MSDTLTPSHNALTARLDHLVVLASSLAEGVQWCEATLGVTPGPGGEHPLMGTHNRLVSIASPLFPAAYLEIIAIHSGAPCERPVGASRWFDLDNQALQQDLLARGPRLAHFVARTAQLQAGVQALARLGLARGEVLQASRATPQGLLSWQITVREDGQRLFNGALPTLIQWGEAHPTQSMAPSGVTLQSLQVQHPQSDALSESHEALGLQGVAVSAGPPSLIATLQTPMGRVSLTSGGM